MSNTPSKAEIEALVKRHGATSYRNRADTQHPAYGFTEDGLNGLIGEVLAKWGTPQPVVREPLTDGQAKEVLWNEHLRWMNAAGLDTEGMRPTGEWLDHWLFYVRAIERAHGIKQKGGN